MSILKSTVSYLADSWEAHLPWVIEVPVSGFESRLVSFYLVGRAGRTGQFDTAAYALVRLEGGV